MRICIISPRYAKEISGGAERLAMNYAEILSEEHSVTVLTTTALDYTTWKNELKSGVSPGNPQIIRFDSKSRRDRNFDKFSKKIQQASSAEKLQEKWLEYQGPYTPELVDSIQKINADVYFFIPYLYYPVVKGIPLVKNKAILIPALHDEWPAYLPMYSKIFTRDIVYSFNTPEEILVFKKIFGFIPKKYAVTGMEVSQIPVSLKKTIYEKYFLVIGRIEEGKGINELIEQFVRWNSKYNDKYSLVLAGKTSGKIRNGKNIIKTGYIDELAKASLLNNAIALVNPSSLESFSIVIMEAWLAKKPVLVNGKSEVLVGHVTRSNGGLWYTDSDSFCAVMDYLQKNPEIASEMGMNGNRYVLQNYNRETIRAKLNHLLQMV